MLNLFALTDNPAHRRLRFSLSQDVQNELTALLTQQEASFRSGGQEEIPFDGKYKPDLGEILVINGFDDLDGLADAVSTPLSIQEVQPTPEIFDTIRALFSGYVNAEGTKTVLLTSP
ncbi:hypothetical protein [Cupriavidus necator]|uniref:hypothetical protein n=1 Tax=Cupriavidus necator TaxID=106590 RepID=UPI0012D2D68C|nr:hypothetical protein [Cupriavidus necator]